MGKKILSIGLISILLTNCISSSATHRVVTESPPSTSPVALRITSTISPTIRPTADSPTYTATLKPTRSKPTSTHTTTPTLSATATVRPYPPIEISPDGKFSAIVFQYDWWLEPPEIGRIEIYDADGILLWTIPWQREFPDYDPHPNFRIYKWSEDSKYLYFYYAFGFDGWPTLWNGFDLQIIELETGITKRVLSGAGLMAFEFSPDNSFIAYTRRQDDPMQLIVRNLRTGQETSYAIGDEPDTYNQAGWISWSPSGDGLIYQTESEEIIRIVYLELITGNQRELISFYAGTAYDSGWSSDNAIIIVDEFNNVSEIDVLTGIITNIGTATPEP